jgi:tetraprenyl-beta-curcumene synthase
VRFWPGHSDSQRLGVCDPLDLLGSGNIPSLRKSDPAPFDPRQAWALAAVATRELLWGLPAVSRELHVWRVRAAAIPDAPIREDALDSIKHKRDHTEGAALFCVLPRSRDKRLLRLLVAYQTIWDFLDNVSERDTGEANARQLHLALSEALDPGASISDYYRHHPWKDDGGYLRELVETCRANCAALPSYSRVRPYVLAGVAQCAVQSVNHDPDPVRRDAALRAWAERESVGEQALAWFEFTAAASGFMPHVLLALAAESSCDERDLAETLAAYFPPVSLAVTMLDSYVDQHEDAASGNHSYISHYGNDDVAVRRLCEIVDRVTRGARGLRNGHRHATLIACMVAMYLSRDSAYAPDMRAGTQALANAGGSLTRLLLPLLRVWRAAYLRRVAAIGRGRIQPTIRSALPPCLPLPRVAQTFVIWKSPFTYLERCRHRYGSRFTINMTSHPPLVFLSDLDDIKVMLAAPATVLHPGEGSAMIEPLVGDQSFMLSEEDEHLSGRRTILPSFHAKVVRRHADMVAAVARREISSWPLGVPFVLHPRLRALTLETVLRTIVGNSGGLADERLYVLRDLLLKTLSVTASPVFPEPLLRHGPGRRIWVRFLRERAEVDELIYAIIEDRCRREDVSDDVLGMLLTARNTDGSQMSSRQVRDNLMSIVLAGHETTASELAWAFQLLAHNPRVLNKLIDEIDGDAAGEEYLTATIQEVLRHRPVFLFAIPRAVKQPIEIGGWSYRPPTQLLGCIYLVHHDPEIYPEPHEFCPERFLGDSPPATYTWLPWGGGRRRCPGLHLAMLEMKTVLRTVLATMTVRPAAKKIEHPRWRSVIVTPHAGSRVVLERR